jgi:hypothetical protein
MPVLFQDKNIQDQVSGYNKHFRWTVMIETIKIIVTWEGNQIKYELGAPTWHMPLSSFFGTIKSIGCLIISHNQATYAQNMRSIT